MSNAATGTPLEQVKPPRTIELAAAAVLLQALSWVAAYAALKLSSSAYTDFLFKHATHGKAKVHYDRTNPADVHTIAKDVSDSQRALLLQAVVLGLAFVLLAFMLRRTRGASAARWSVVVVSVLTQSPLLVLSVQTGLPAGLVASQFIIGLSSLAALVLLFLPASRQYFRQCREAVAATLPPRPARTGGLFGPRASAPAPGGAKPRVQMKKSAVADDDAAGEDDAESARASSQEKKRTEAAAVAKGAALARSRAKAAAKSRRMEE